MGELMAAGTHIDALLELQHERMNKGQRRRGGCVCL